MYVIVLSTVSRVSYGNVKLPMALQHIPGMPLGYLQYWATGSNIGMPEALRHQWHCAIYGSGLRTNGNIETPTVLLAIYASALPTITLRCLSRTLRYLFVALPTPWCVCDVNIDEHDRPGMYLPAKGGVPASIMNVSTPTDHRSHCTVYAPDRHSGAMLYGVPTGTRMTSSYQGEVGVGGGGEGV